MNAAVRAQLAVEPVCRSCVGSDHVQHIFLAVRGIELNSTPSASDDSRDWLKLLPEDSAEKPVQVDLMESTIDPGNSKPLMETVQVPAGVYREARVRFAPNQPMAEDWVPQSNSCASGTFNCIVMADGVVHPLPLGVGTPELRITSETMEDASLLFPPDTRSELIIELKVVWELSSSHDTGVRLVPALVGSAKVRRMKFDELGPFPQVIAD